jgi:hypothetical protein
MLRCQSTEKATAMVCRSHRGNVLLPKCYRKAPQKLLFTFVFADSGGFFFFHANSSEPAWFLSNAADKISPSNKTQCLIDLHGTPTWTRTPGPEWHPSVPIFSSTQLLHPSLCLSTVFLLIPVTFMVCKRAHEAPMMKYWHLSPSYSGTYCISIV